MEISIAAVCDYALLDDNGKMSMMGLFDIVRVARVPSLQPRMFVCVQIRCRSIEAGTTHTLSMRVHDSDGRPLVTDLRGAFVVPTEIFPGAPLSVQLMMDLQGVRFDRLGAHSIEIAIDGSHMRSIPLHVAQVPSGEPGSPASND